MLRLRPYKPSDADTIVRWITDEKTFYLWSAGRMGTWPADAAGLDAYYRSLPDATSWQMTAVDEQDIPRGHLMMRFVDENRNSLHLGHIVVDSSLRGMGYGKELLALAQAFAQHCMKVERITLGVFENNPAARHCYEAFGFKQMSSPVFSNCDEMMFTLASGQEEWNCIWMEKSIPVRV